MAKTSLTKKPIPKKYRSTIDDLAIATATLNNMQGTIDLHRLAIVGAVHEAQSLQIPMGDLLDYIRPITEGLAHLENDLYETAGAILDACKRLYREKDGRR